MIDTAASGRTSSETEELPEVARLDAQRFGRKMSRQFPALRNNRSLARKICKLVYAWTARLAWEQEATRRSFGCSAREPPGSDGANPAVTKTWGSLTERDCPVKQPGVFVTAGWVSSLAGGPLRSGPNSSWSPPAPRGFRGLMGIGKRWAITRSPQVGSPTFRISGGFVGARPAPRSPRLVESHYPQRLF